MSASQVLDTEDLTMEDADSRTASFEHKRRHEEFTQPTEPCGSPFFGVTDTKNSKLPTTDDLEAVSLNDENTADHRGNFEAATNASIPKSSGHAPSMNWNSGTKAKIRTSLGGIRSSFGAQNKAIDAVPGLESTKDTLPSHDSDHLLNGVHARTREETLVPLGTTAEVEQAQPYGPVLKDGVAPSPAVADPDDTGVAINLEEQEQTDEQESGEISEDIPYISRSGQKQAENLHPRISEHSGEEQDDDTISDSTSEEDDDEEEIESGEELEDGEELAEDPMVDYYASSPAGNDIDEKPVPRILADLNLNELKLQLRYFYVSRDPKTIDLNDPVNCLVCAKPGHTSNECDKLICTTCGTFKEHFTRNCPVTRKCHKCYERGHQGPDCPYKLPRSRVDKVECDLCQRQGHIEDKCELLWRTSGKPWESELLPRSSKISCYECGGRGHLGNKCPTRQPRKPLGSSSWSAEFEQPPGPRQPSAGISIKGLAEQQRVIPIDDSEDERANFYRPRIPLPVRNGHIRIPTLSSKHHQGASFTPINAQPQRVVFDDYRSQDPFNNSRFRGQDYHHRDDPRYPRNDFDFHPYDDGRHYQPQPRHRSRSPISRDGRDNYRPDFEQDVHAHFRQEGLPLPVKRPKNLDWRPQMGPQSSPKRGKRLHTESQRAWHKRGSEMGKR